MVLSTRRSAKRGKLPGARRQLLVDIPLDVLVEIFLLLEPLDLLYLARTTKGLREFLLNRRKASGLWKNVIGNIKDFPPCPDHMSPPAYAHLAFLPVCHRCFRPCKTIEWELRMRCCPDCFPKMTMPRFSFRNKSSNYLDALDLPIAREHYKLCDSSTLDIRFSIETVSRSFSHSLLDWKAVQSRKRLRKVSVEEFLSQENDYWGSIQRHASLCRDWERRRLQEEAAQLSHVRQQRVKDIEDKLKESGWSDIISLPFDYDLLKLPEVRKIEPLTSTEWAKIRPGLIIWAQEAREDMIWNKCMSTFNSVSLSIQQEFRSNTSLKVRPRGVDIAMLPALHSALESVIHSDTMCDDLKGKLLRALPPAIKKWSADAVQELEQFAREQLGLPPLSKPSCLPAIIFRCKLCSRGDGPKRQSRFTFDEALSHDHLYKERRRVGEKVHTGEMSVKDKLAMRYCTYPRNIQALQVDVIISRRVENLITRMGQNPGRITSDELLRSTIKVVCGLCSPKHATRMNFEHALGHCLSAHVTGKETEVWTRVSARE